MQRVWVQRVRLVAILASLAGVAACGEPPSVRGYPPQAASWPTPPPPPPEVVAPPPIPQVPLNIPTAIAADPEAQRFYALRRLVAAGLATPEEAEARRTANLGALLPYSEPPPAAGLARPAPLQMIADQIARLSARPPALAAEAATERGFLLESLLPQEPKTRAAPARIAPDALKLGRDRVDTMARLGLVNSDERMRELATIAQGERVLANTPPPPPPPKKKPRKKPAQALKPGDVPGGVIPPSGKGPVGLHLLSMASDHLTAKAVDALKKEYPELAPLEFKAVKTDIPDLGTTYRLLAGPIPAAEAEPFCVALRAKGQSCAVASY
ncbi:MAG: SPOR domain-containing protein [Phaeospirillum sp.]|nr:SPOR domain-containing protein [Phaeospirillum sp.]